MKISYPLSLKISLWLLLNLALLGAVGVGFLLMHGGVGWNVLMEGAAGDHVRVIGETAMSEVQAAAFPARNFSCSATTDPASPALRRTCPGRCADNWSRRLRAARDRVPTSTVPAVALRSRSATGRRPLHHPTIVLHRATSPGAALRRAAAAGFS